MREKLKQELSKIIERMWQDVSGLPWQDPVWTGNLQLKKKTKDHYVSSTLEDLLKIIMAYQGQEANKNGKSQNRG